MAPPGVVSQDACEALAHVMFDPYGCEACGVTVLRGASSWGAHETGRIVVPNKGGEVAFDIAYDEREAPYVVGADGHEATSVMLSLADEDDYLACCWARTDVDSPLLGVGVDLASTLDFGGKPSAQRFIRLLFTNREHEVAQELFPNDPTFAYTALFGAKEAGFKATAQPLRTWYRSHEEELAFEVRHFVAADCRHERGEGRDGAAQRAMDATGIVRIEWHVIPIEGMALVVACALGE